MDFTIGKTTPTVTATDTGGVYNGSSFAATATVAGVDGMPGSSLEGVSPTLLYYAGSDTSGVGSTSAPVTAGTYTVVASFAGSNDYAAAQSHPVTFTITYWTAPVTVVAQHSTISSVTATTTARTIAHGATGMPWVLAASALQTMTVWHSGGGKPPGKAQPLNTERLGQQESHFLLPGTSAGEQGRNAERTVPDLQVSEASIAPLSETETGDLPPPALVPPPSLQN